MTEQYCLNCGHPEQDHYPARGEFKAGCSHDHTCDCHGLALVGPYSLASYPETKLASPDRSKRPPINFIREMDTADWGAQLKDVNDFLLGATAIQAYHAGLASALVMRQIGKLPPRELIEAASNAIDAEQAVRMTLAWIEDHLQKQWEARPMIRGLISKNL